MAATADPLQGSLFGDAKILNSDSKDSQNNSQSSNQDFSDKELTADAQIRPRTGKGTKPKKEIFSDNLNGASPDSDLPKWSHHKLVDINQLTPVLRHYVELKTANPERVLLYRLGDFFECFFEDAITLSQILELALTGKEGGKTIGRVPMAGIPHHAAERYCSELIRQGLSVAICDQLESTPTKGALIKRAITRVLTPGTVIEEGMLQARRNNWLAALVIDDKNLNQSFCWGLATADVSTGEFVVMEKEGTAVLYQELNKIDASELIWSRSEATTSHKWCPDRLHITEIPRTIFTLLEAELALKKHFDLATINGIGLQDYPLALRAAGGLLSYLNNTNPISEARNQFGQSTKIPLDFPQITFPEDSLIIDSQTG